MDAKGLATIAVEVCAVPGWDTARCVLRPFAKGDIAAFMAYRNDEVWMRHQGFKGLTAAEYEAALLGGQSLEKGVQLAIVERETGMLLGDLYLRRAGDTFWLGYTIAPHLARRGYGAEAAAGAIEWMRQNGAACVKAGVEPGNAASIALLEKLGFAREGGEEDGELVYALRL